MDLFDNLIRWNLWGSWKIPSSFVREKTQSVYRYSKTEEVIALIGPRRAGKSTILYQVMQRLLDEGISEKAILHINFEEPGLSPQLKIGLIDELYNLHRAKVFPKGRAFIFLDEIQNVPEWERWVRARNDTDDIKLFITGSSSSLLSGELATVLGGRHFRFDIFPLSFKEVLQFKKIDLPKEPFPTAPPAEIHYALNEYLQWGGFPRVVLAEDDEERQFILKQYFDDILFKDIVQRYQIRNVTALKNIAIHLLTNTSTLISYKRLANIFQVSPEVATSYTHHLREAFMINTLDAYSLKASERTRNPMKIHAIDLGLRKVVSLSESTDETKLLETQVHNTLRRREAGDIFYWKGEGEIDLLTQNGNAVTNLYQVAYAGLENENVAKREFGGLEKAIEQFRKAKPYLITWLLNDKIDLTQYPDISVLPLWRFLLT